MQKRISVLIVSVIVVLSSCSKNKEQVQVPTIKLEEAYIGSEGGVTLNAYVLQAASTIIDHGFIIATDSSLSTSVRSISLGKQLNSNSFTLTIDNGLIKGQIYFFKAYLKTDKGSYYSETKPFLSNGIPAPIIKSISSDFGYIGDTITISGKYFTNMEYGPIITIGEASAIRLSYTDSLIQCIVPAYMNDYKPEIIVTVVGKSASYTKFQLHTPQVQQIIPVSAVMGDTIVIVGTHFDKVKDRNTIYFDDVTAKVIDATRDSLFVVVPFEMKNPEATIRIRAQLQEALADQKFLLSAPVINNVSKLTATFRDEIIITGDHFHTTADKNLVYFGDVVATITYADKKQLKVTVPDGLLESTTDIKVKAQLQTVIYKDSFILRKPEIDYIIPSVSAYQTIEIKGKYFHPIAQNNKIFIENISSSVSSETSGVLNTKMPAGPYPRRKAKIILQLLDYIIEYEPDLTIKDKWVMVSNTLPFSYYRMVNNAVVINNDAYVIVPDNMWKLNKADYTWQQLPIPFEVKSWHSSAESQEGKIYLYSAEAPISNFWEYNPQLKQWNARAPFPGKNRFGATHFSTKGHIYIGIGAGYLPYGFSVEPFSDFYKYNIASNSWIRIADFTHEAFFQRTETASFVINNIPYFGNGAYHTGIKDFWKYNEAANQWERIADFVSPGYSSQPIAFLSTAAFSLNGLGYVTGGSSVGGSANNLMSIYDPVKDSWTEGANIGHPRSYHFAFAVNDKGYVGGGNLGNELWEFIP
ncbi:MAG: IPT/TIG domain-containing protein [Niabella sp.]